VLPDYPQVPITIYRIGLHQWIATPGSLEPPTEPHVWDAVRRDLTTIPVNDYIMSIAQFAKQNLRSDQRGQWTVYWPIILSVILAAYYSGTVLIILTVFGSGALGLWVGKLVFNKGIA